MRKRREPVAARQVGRRRATTQRRGPNLTLEVAGLDRRGLEALRLELTRLAGVRGLRLAQFRVIETDRSP